MPKFIFGTFAVALLGVLGSNALATDKTSTIQIKVSSTGTDNSARYKTLKKFKEDLEGKLGDKVNVVISEPNAAFKEGEEFEALGLDLVNIIVPSSSQVASQYKYDDLYIFELPYLFRTNEDVLKYIKSSLPENLLKDFDKKEHVVTPLAIWFGDFKDFYGDRPLNRVELFNNLSGGVEANNGISKIYQSSLGVSNVRAYENNQLANYIIKNRNSAPNVTELSSSFILDKNIYPHYKDLTRSQHAIKSYIVLSNKRWFNKLPDDVKSAIKDISVSLGEYHLAEDRKVNVDAMAKLVTDGIKVHNIEQGEKTKMINRAIPAHENYLKNINGQYLQEVYKAVR